MANNTGYKGFFTLLRVVNGGTHNGEALDVNSNLCSVTGLTQFSKPNNASDLDYIAPIQDETACPIPVAYYVMNKSLGWNTQSFSNDTCNVGFGSPEALYTINPNGQIIIGDIVYMNNAESPGNKIAFGLLSPNNYLGYTDINNIRGWVKVSSTGDVLEKGTCVTEPLTPCNISLLFTAIPSNGQYTMDASSDVTTASDVIISVSIRGTVSGVTEYVSITLPNGFTHAEQDGIRTTYNTQDDVIFTITGFTPASDSVREYNVTQQV